MTLRASTGDRVLMIGSPGLLVVLGLYGVAGAGLSSLGGVLLVVGLGLWVAAAWTMPWTAVVDGDGVRVRMLARSRNEPWDDIIAFERHRRRGGGALVVRTIDRRRFPMMTSVERPAEWDRLRELVGEHAPGVAVADPPPSHPFSRKAGED